MPGVSGALLLGGASRRMGTDKAALAVTGGVPMALRALAVLGGLFRDVLAVDRPGRASAVALPPGVRAAADPAGAPPCALAGIAGALAAARAPWVFVLACDMPFPSPLLIRGLARMALDLPGGGPRAVVPRAGGVLHPLCAVYHRDLLETVRARLAAGDLKAGALAEAAGAVVAEDALRALDPALAGLINVNTPDDLAAARHRAAARELPG